MRAIMGALFLTVFVLLTASYIRGDEMSLWVASVWGGSGALGFMMALWKDN